MKNTKVGLLIIALIALVVGVSIFATKSKPQYLPQVPQGIACTEEAKQCPDGSYVGRTGPQCQFSACPTDGGTSVPPSTSKSGISGIVSLGPTCPVMRNPPDPQCADKPYQTTLVVLSEDGAKTITTFISDATGKFKVSVPPGVYVIQSPANKMYPRCSSNGPVTVRANTFTDISISCDTGIR